MECGGHDERLERLRGSGSSSNSTLKQEVALESISGISPSPHAPPSPRPPCADNNQIAKGREAGYRVG